MFVLLTGEWGEKGDLISIQASQCEVVSLVPVLFTLCPLVSVILLR